MSSTEEHLRELAAIWAGARTAEESARESLIAAAREAYAGGMSKYRIGQVTGAARATVDKWLTGVEKGGQP